MATNKHINPSSHQNNDTGFGNNADTHGGRFVNKDGSYNLIKRGIPFLERFSIYHKLLSLPRWKFSLVICLFFFAINLIYTLLYIVIGKAQFQGTIATTNWHFFKEMFYFSTETFTTVGYGRVNPVGDAANIVAAIESLNGFLSFALATGLMYGRFSKPKSYLLFSNHALISPYQDKTAFMFRIASFKDYHNLTNVEIRVTMALLTNENGKSKYNFYELELERIRVDTLIMNWTVVHPIDEKSPLLGLTAEDMQAGDLEVYVNIRGFDDVYSATVTQRSSYTYDEIVFNAKFVQMYHESEDRNTTIFDISKLNEYKLLS